MPSDYLLEIDGIKGESKDSKKKDAIEVNSYSFGVSNAGSFASGTGGGTGKANFQDLSFSTIGSKASPKLAEACATGKHIGKATLTCRKAGGKQENYLIITLNDILISSYQSSGAGGELANDSFSINFAKIEFEYLAQDAKGTTASAGKFKYDVKASKNG